MHLKLTFSFALLLSLPYLVDGQAPAANTVEIKVTAKKYEFRPSTIRVKKGDHVRLMVTATDREHGIKIAAFKIEHKLPKGEEVPIEFTADQTGIFPFECSVFCGMGHRKMKGQLIVE